MLPSIFNENVFDDLFDQTMNMDMFGRRNPLYGKHAKELMKADVRETEDSYVLDIDLPDEMIEKVVEGVKAKIKVDDVKGILDGVKGLFGK